MQAFNKEQLEHIKTLSNLLFTPAEIAVMIEVEDIELFVKLCLNKEGESIYKAYQGGRLEQEMIIRKSILTAAKNGSPPAQSMAAKLILNSKLNER